MTESRTPFADRPTLVGEKVLLRPARPQEDLSALRTTLDAPKAPERARATERRTVKWWHRSRNRQADRLDLIVVDRSTDRGVGEIVLDQWDEPNNSCTLRIAIAPDGRDRGFETEALRLLTDHAFRVLGLRRVSLSVRIPGHSIQSACQQAGFRVEGVRRKAVRYGDRWANVIDMAALAEDWGHELPSGPEPERTGDPELRLTDAEWTRLRDYLRRYVMTELDQFENWRIDTQYGPIAVTFTNDFPEDADHRIWHAI
ncbi:GNAT family N-acetyltransferase [Kitasatospora sp. NPDC051984]|uniref:GNAT family N-acetyltransferase n=1 Tax=Kitasatospora sp. NPDC051984 TaxID=3364059 RepID=UPI0037C7B1C7